MFRPWEISEENQAEVQAEVQAEEPEDDDDMPSNIENAEDGTKRHRYLSSDAKELIRNLWKSLTEKQCPAPIKVASELVKVPYSTVRDIVKSSGTEKRKRESGKFSRISEELGLEIRKVIYDMYSEHVVPTTITLKNRLLELGYEINYCEESFRCYLRSIGFDYKTLDQRLTIMETPRLKKWRWEYITQIRKYRAEGRYIVYLDETWYDTHDVKKKGLSDGSSKCALQTPPSRGKRIIILHAGGVNGWVTKGLLLSAKQIKNCSADYHCDMDSTLFETWFQQQLLPSLPPKSVIVMDNASYHSTQINKKPTTATRKEDILEYMRRNSIEIPPGKVLKKDLLNMVKSLDIKKQYRVDEIAESRGHDVLRLPPYYCVLNPIELMWSTLKKAVRKNNTSPSLSGSVVDLVRKEVDNISKDIWKNCVDHVIKIEDSYVSPHFQELIINVNESDDDSDFYFESDEEN